MDYAFDTPDIGQEVFTVSELNRCVRNLLEGEFPLIVVEGEISNFVRPASGHCYFTLKDEQAQVRCAMFRNRNLYLRFKPKSGDHVRVRARVSLYEGRGEFQLIVEQMEPVGEGALQKAFEDLKRRLQQEGLFTPEHKQPLPTLPHHIGVITSPTGAAIRDILTVLRRRFPAIPVTLFPVAVQGSEAPGEIVRAIELANRASDCDVLIVGRGGGSLEDLWGFNDERVARALYASRIPTVSAVGHEIDFTIADFVADVRAPTPSAAAELVVPNREDWLTRLAQLEQRLSSRISQQLHFHQHKLDAIAKRLRHPGQRLQEQMQRLDEHELRLRNAMRNHLQTRRDRLATASARLQQHNPARQLQPLQQQLHNLEQRLQRSMQGQQEQYRQKLVHLARTLETVSPLATLSRGYAIVHTDDEEHRIVRDAASVQIGDAIEARLHRGSLHCTVKRIDRDDSP